MTNGCHSAGRRVAVSERHQPSPAEPVESAEAAVVVGDTNRMLLDAVRALPRRQRESVVLRYYAELSEAETAEVLGISVGSVKTHTHRGLARLGAELETAR